MAIITQTANGYTVVLPGGAIHTRSALIDIIHLCNEHGAGLRYYLPAEEI